MLCPAAQVLSLYTQCMSAILERGEESVHDRCNGCSADCRCGNDLNDYIARASNDVSRGANQPTKDDLRIGYGYSLGTDEDEKSCKKWKDKTQHDEQTFIDRKS